MEAVTAAVEQELDAQEWNMQEMERMQQAQVCPSLPAHAPIRLSRFPGDTCCAYFWACFS